MCVLVVSTAQRAVAQGTDALQWSQHAYLLPPAVMLFAVGQDGWGIERVAPSWSALEPATGCDGAATLQAGVEGCHLRCGYKQALITIRGCITQRCC